MAIINTVQQVNDTLSALTQEVDFTVGTFSKKMSSNEANSIFSRFGVIINSLYEKARYLQDLREYTEMKIESVYSDKYRKLKAITDSIEDIESQYQRDKQVVHEVLPSSESAHAALLDFDGSTVGNALIMPDSTLTSGCTEIYCCTLERNENARYASDKDGSFSCAIGFEAQKGMASINYIEAITSNCTVKSIEIEGTGKEKHNIDSCTASFMDVQPIGSARVSIEMSSGQEQSKSSNEIGSLDFV